MHDTTNRTTLELKLTYTALSFKCSRPTNRTTLELKQKGLREVFAQADLPIAPHWN